MPEYRYRFSGPAFIEETIRDENNGIIGTIRIKPSTILWLPRGEQKYFAVRLDDFTDWITSSKKAYRTTR